jgi:hypothetical protein
MKLILLILVSLVLFATLFSIEIPYSSVPVSTDANLFQNFFRIDPDDKKLESLPTKVWLWYDEDNMYLKIEAKIDSTFIKGEYSPRDVYVKSDYVRIQLITIPEAYYAYYYEFHASGSLTDGIRKTDMSIDYNWNSAYSYTTENNDSLWTMIAKLPFKDLRFNTKPPYEWKVILTRFNQKHEEFYSHPYANIKELKDYFNYSENITLTHKIKRSSDWKFRPYFVKGYDMIEKKETFDPEHVGMDISFNPSTKTKLKVALNPDFSDVPPDDAQNNYNDKNPPFYSENRFFFTEDIDAFGVDYDVFYTRFIVQPQIAAKFTGNSKTWNYGYLCAKDKKIVSDGEVINTDDFYQLASVMKTLPRLQVILSEASRMNTGYYNHLGIASWDWEFKKKLHFGTSHIVSTRHVDESAEQEEDNKIGSMFHTHFRATPGNWDINLKYNNLQKDLRVDTGTYWDTGYEDFRLNASWNSIPKEKYLRSMNVYSNVAYSNKLEPHRPLNYANAGLSSTFSFLPKYALSINAYRIREEYHGKEHDGWNSSLNVNWYKYDTFSMSLNEAMGKTVIYRLNETSIYNMVSLYTWGSIGQKLNWSASVTEYLYDYDRIHDNVADGDTIVLDNNYQIGSASVNYNFNNNMSWRNGLSITTYDADGCYSNLTFYSNYRYEFKKEWFLYLGYQTGQYQDDKSIYSDPMGHFVRYQASAYLKVSVTM